ncbi:hypothetical protein DOT_0059 [Desulfosporosinus sp. OT]|nr:hypothetical protein DOT_0059 [Desulfosporosinus sp. OT]
MLLRCPNCQSMDHLSKWVNCTAKTLKINILSAAKNPVYVCPKCKSCSPRASIPRISH